MCIRDRYEGEGVTTPGVGAFDSYRSFGGHNAHGHQLLFRSIDTWLDGVCVSHCKTCTWGESAGKPSKLFAAGGAEQQQLQQQQRCVLVAGGE